MAARVTFSVTGHLADWYESSASLLEFAEARALVKLLCGIPAKINLIPFNPWPNTKYECSDWETIERFAEIVNRAGYASPVRTPRGRDILAIHVSLWRTSE